MEGAWRLCPRSGRRKDLQQRLPIGGQQGRHHPRQLLRRAHGFDDAGLRLGGQEKPARRLDDRQGEEPRLRSRRLQPHQERDADSRAPWDRSNATDAARADGAAEGFAVVQKKSRRPGAVLASPGRRNKMGTLFETAAVTRNFRAHYGPVLPCAIDFADWFYAAKGG